jgi:hypothetical protein
LQLLNLRPEGLEVNLLRALQDTVGDAVLDHIEFGLAQRKGSQRLADGQSEGIQGFLIVIDGIRGGSRYGGCEQKKPYGQT